MFIWDCHHMISTFIKGNTPKCVNSKIQYRSFKDFDVNKYISDLDNTEKYHINHQVPAIYQESKYHS
jgi:hypothetical protein